MRIILCFLLALVAAPAWAEWVKVGAAEDDSVTVYIDPTRIRKSGNFRKVWQITDRNQRDEEGVLSRRSLIEYDCKEERRRTLAISTHSELMARGNMLYSGDGVSEWSAIPPESLAEAALQIVCAK